MKIFGVDLSYKWITFETDDKKYTVQFKESLIKGIHSIEVYSICCDVQALGKRVKIKNTNSYPPLKRIIYELVRIWLPNWIATLKHQLHNNKEP